MRTADEIIPRLIVCIPHSSHAPFALNEIADDIQDLSICLGGLNKVAEIVGVSESMLNWFLRVKKLTPKIQILVNKRVIDSVSIVHGLAKFSSQDQDEIANHILSKQINSQDLRLLSPLRKQFPSTPILELIEKLQNSENKKVSVIRFDMQDLKKDVTILHNDLLEVVGASELIAIVNEGDQGLIKITSKGESLLRKAAKKVNKTLEQFIYSLL